MFSTPWFHAGRLVRALERLQNAMPGPSLQDSGSFEEAEAASLDAQLKAWFDAMLKAPVPAYLLRHVERMERPGDDEER